MKQKENDPNKDERIIVDVRISWDYDKFKFLKENREIQEPIVKEIIRSIKNIGYIQERPILIDLDWFIIDGQQRWAACKRENLPIIYQIANVKGKQSVKMMIDINIFQRKWVLFDYVTSWSKVGKEDYIKLVEFERTYKLGISLAVNILAGSNCGDKLKAIREGKGFQINPNADKIIDFIKRSKDYLFFNKEIKFVRALIVLYSKVSEKKIAKLLEKVGMIRQQATTAAYLNHFENIINKGLRDHNDRISLIVN